MTTRIGEFRSRLQLTQPSAQLLLVQFEDADPAKSAATSNAVAKTLTAQSPSPVTAPPPAVTPQPAPPPAAPVKQPVASHPNQPASPLAAALRDLEDHLQSTDRQLDKLSSPNRQLQAHELPSYTLSRQQQLLKASIRAAQRQLEDLRAQYRRQSSAARINNRLGEIQHELSSVLLAGHASQPQSRTHAFIAAGVSSSALRDERAQLTHALGVIEKDRQAIQREEAASGSEPASAPEPAPAPAAQVATQQPAPAAPPPSPAAWYPNPFRLARPAGSTAFASWRLPSWHPVSWLPASWQAKSLDHPWWTAAIAGLFCALLYLAFAARARPLDYEESDIDLTTHSSHRLITPDVPFVAPTPASVPLVNKLENDIPDPTPTKRASFTFDPPFRESTPSPATPFEHEPSTISSAIGEQESPALNPQANILTSDPPVPFKENVVKIDDTWADQIARTLAQTEIGRMLEGSPAQQDATGTNRENNDSQQPSAQPNRRVG